MDATQMLAVLRKLIDNAQDIFWPNSLSEKYKFGNAS